MFLVFPFEMSSLHECRSHLLTSLFIRDYMSQPPPYVVDGVWAHNLRRFLSPSGPPYSHQRTRSRHLVSRGPVVLSVILRVGIPSFYPEISFIPSSR